MSTQWTSNPLPESKPAGSVADLVKEGYVVLLLYGKNSFGDKIYSYLKVTLENLKLLKEAAAKNGSFTPSDFGQVVAAGVGEPSDEVRAEIRTTYHYMEMNRNAAAKPVAPQTAVPIPQEKKGWDEY